jgi:hypothetical protein
MAIVARLLRGEPLKLVAREANVSAKHEPIPHQVIDRTHYRAAIHRERWSISVGVAHCVRYRPQILLPKQIDP